MSRRVIRYYANLYLDTATARKGAECAMRRSFKRLFFRIWLSGVQGFKLGYLIGLWFLSPGVNSRGGKQHFRGEQCAWKRVSKDGNHYRILEHPTGYFYQQGILPS